ncbi:hypothetical protein ACQ86G_20585 [Roseateles chitinivorans]|uniref:hypothetical protein n=1 Tax=Roseateles chitinivorans TaxID=2917965 RepID=UPI003D67C626
MPDPRAARRRVDQDGVIVVVEVEAIDVCTGTGRMSLQSVHAAERQPGRERTVDQQQAGHRGRPRVGGGGALVGAGGEHAGRDDAVDADGDRREQQRVGHRVAARGPAARRAQPVVERAPHEAGGGVQGDVGGGGLQRRTADAVFGTTDQMGVIGPAAAQQRQS